MVIEAGRKDETRLLAVTLESEPYLNSISQDLVILESIANVGWSLMDHHMRGIEIMEITRREEKSWFREYWRVDRVRVQNLSLGSPLSLTLEFAPAALGLVVLGILRFLRDYRPRQEMAWAKARRQSAEAQLQSVLVQAAEDRRLAEKALLDALRDAVEQSDYEVGEKPVHRPAELLETLGSLTRLRVIDVRDLSQEQPGT